MMRTTKGLNDGEYEVFGDVPPQSAQVSFRIAHALTRGMGWGSCEPPESADEGISVKPP
jgi:hypothetical protein